MAFSSFLSLNSKPALKSRPAAKQDDAFTRNKLPEHRASSAEIEVNDKDDEWYDTATSSEDLSPVKKTSSANIEDSIVSVKNITPEQEAALLPYMPALFSMDLPPCGMEVQVAYEIVNTRLRQTWLNHRGRLSAVDICQAVKAELRDQNYLWPPYSVKGRFKRRQPWCRENVFKFQLRWIDYFSREAHAQIPELMTESEIMDRKKQSSIPLELGLDLQRGDVMRLWDQWHEKKRAKTPQMPDVEMESVLGGALPISEAQKEATGGIKEVRSLLGASEEPIVTTPAIDGTDDAHVWSSGGHD